MSGEIRCGLKRFDGHFTGNRRELLQELVEGITGFKVGQQILKWNTSAAKTGDSPQNLRIAHDDGSGHVSHLKPALYRLHLLASNRSLRDIAERKRQRSAP